MNHEWTRIEHLLIRAIRVHSRSKIAPAKLLFRNGLLDKTCRKNKELTDSITELKINGVGGVPTTLRGRA